MAWIKASAGMTERTFIGKPESCPFKELENAWTQVSRLKPPGRSFIGQNPPARFSILTTFEALITNLSAFRPHRLARSRTPAFHAGNTGSNPVGDASEIKGLAKHKPILFCFGGKTGGKIATI
jgi:hypothetical protein